MKDQINIYSCPECGQETVTIDRDEGTTPMFLKCRATPGCMGRAVSRFYPKFAPGEAPEPVWEWYKPNAEEATKQGPAMLHHAMMGGLFLRPIAPKEDTPE